MAAPQENRTLIPFAIMGLKPTEPDHRPYREPWTNQLHFGLKAIEINNLKILVDNHMS